MDLIAELNTKFRSLYGRNRDESLVDVPLAGLTLIGTGEIWRVEYGQLIKSYKPIKTIPNIKGSDAFHTWCLCGSCGVTKKKIR